jgi:hypothetical protein
VATSNYLYCCPWRPAWSRRFTSKHVVPTFGLPPEPASFTEVDRQNVRDRYLGLVSATVWGFSEMRGERGRIGWVVHPPDAVSAIERRLAESRSMQPAPTGPDDMQDWYDMQADAVLEALRKAKSAGAWLVSVHESHATCFEEGGNYTPEDLDVCKPGSRIAQSALVPVAAGGLLLGGLALCVWRQRRMNARASV